MGDVQTHTVIVAETPLPGSLAQPQPPHQEEDAEPELYCVCQQSVTAEHAMLCCDSCFDWYHLKCVGLTPSAGKSSKRYTCPVCAALKGYNSDVLEHALSKVGPGSCCGVLLATMCWNTWARGAFAVCRLLQSAAVP